MSQANTTEPNFDSEDSSTLPEGRWIVPPRTAPRSVCTIRPGVIWSS